MWIRIPKLVSEPRKYPMLRWPVVHYAVLIWEYALRHFTVVFYRMIKTQRQADSYPDLAPPPSGIWGWVRRVSIETNIRPFSGRYRKRIWVDSFSSLGKTSLCKQLILNKKGLVEIGGLEPPTPCSQSRIHQASQPPHFV